MTAAGRPSVTDNARAEAWDEGYQDGLRQGGEGEDGPRYVNPYRAAGRAETTTACTCDVAPAEIGGVSHRPGCGEAETTTATTEDKSVIERAATVIIANTDEPMWSAVVIAKEMASRGLLATARTRPTETTTEWGVRTGNGHPYQRPDEASARRHAAHLSKGAASWTVVRREVGPWTEAE